MLYLVNNVAAYEQVVCPTCVIRSLIRIPADISNCEAHSFRPTCFNRCYFGIQKALSKCINVIRTFSVSVDHGVIRVPVLGVSKLGTQEGVGGNHFHSPPGDQNWRVNVVLLIRLDIQCNEKFFAQFLTWLRS